MNDGWEFWLDVGGTFTDCVARRPDGALARYKILSTGIVNGAAAPGSTAEAIVDPARRGDPAQVWRGYTLAVVDRRGSALASARVVDFDPAAATLALDRPLSVAVEPGAAYELASGEAAPLVAIRYLLGLPAGTGLPPVAVRLGTTRGTNALLTRRGARTALLVTRGFGDILRIGNQDRPRLFELAIRKPEPLFETVLEIDERIAAEGTILEPLDTARAADGLARLRATGIESLAICLLHSHVEPVHEIRLETLARQLGFEDVSRSSRVAPLAKIVSRGDTTVVDAYLNPVLGRYVGELRRALGDGELRLMTSAGGLVSAERFHGKDSVLSGPAGGVVGFSRIAQAAGIERSIGFDMGGTSTDVSRCDGQFEYQYETQKAGVRIVAPMLAIETVAAGGGSICRFDGVKLVVGPASAGADPGPACYGRGGPLTVTDLNVHLGRIPQDRFPFPLDRMAVDERLAELVDEVARATGTVYTGEALCEGLLKIANTNMVQAIRSISIARGVDPAGYVLVAFGGAGGQHACAVARELGIRTILEHPDAGLLSAYGIGLGDVTAHRVQGIYADLSPSLEGRLAAIFAELAVAARGEVLAEGIPPQRIAIRRCLDVRYRGQEGALTVSVDDGPEVVGSAEISAVQASFGLPADAPSADGIAAHVAAGFVAAHRKLYGYVHRRRAIEVVAARVEAVGRTLEPNLPAAPDVQGEPRPSATVEVAFSGRRRATAIYHRDALGAHQQLAGPAIVCGGSSTTVIEPHWRGRVLARGELLLTDEAAPVREAVSTEADPVMLEVFNNQFAGIAQQMGITLRNTASSVNVKERLDFSCALFTAEGDLVVNAPHIPVHLGAMSETVRRVVADNPGLHPQDVIVTNDPYRGGSHLPDVTVVTPVFDAAGREPLFFVASRAHHAEIGGTRPGSMPPFSRTLAEEGVLIRNFKLVDRGRPRDAALRRLLASGAHPSRNPDDNLADVAAQVAANRQGASDLLRLVERYSWPVVAAYMHHIQQAAAAKLRRSLDRLPRGPRRFVDHLDDGTPLAVAVSHDGRWITLDFSGTGPVSPGNLNANRAIVAAAAMYCLRTLIDEDIPLNQGVLAPLVLVVPEGLLAPPERSTPEACAAVVGGNVETSQRIVDVVLGAFGIAAASQGTMNNLLFGDAGFGYYETICGGAGAVDGAAGADAVHTHMTNTRLTDPEVLEARYPVRVRSFAIRSGSGGAGRYRGGDGAVRELEFLRPLTVSILSQRRGPYPPYGMAGGRPGQLGRNLLLRPGAAPRELPGCVELEVLPGDVLRIETPGGGGWGEPGDDRRGEA